MEMAFLPINCDLTEHEIKRVTRSHIQLIGFLKIWQKYIQTNTVVVDLGANIGLYTLCFAILAHKVHAIEGSLSNCKKLATLCGKLKNVRIHKVAVGNLNQSRKMEFPDCSTPKPRLQSVKFVKFDEYALKHNIHPGFIKMDIEGMESLALSSMTRLIDQVRPVWQIEYHPNGKLFDPLGFDFSSFKSRGYLVYNSQMQSCDFCKHDNYFVVPTENHCTKFFM